MSPSRAILFLSIVLLCFSSCTRVPKTAEGEPLFWCTYDLFIVDLPYTHADPIDRFFDDQDPPIPASERTLERLLQEADFTLSPQGQIDPTALPAIRILETPENHVRLAQALRANTSNDWHPFPAPHQLNATITLGGRVYGVLEGVYPQSDVGLWFMTKRGAVTSILWGSDPVDSFASLYLWNDAWFAFHRSSLTYHGPAWPVILILLGVPIALGFFLRRPIGRVFQLRSRRS